jgi:hypothetical protein
MRKRCFADFWERRPVGHILTAPMVASRTEYVCMFGDNSLKSDHLSLHRTIRKVPDQRHYAPDGRPLDTSPEPKSIVDG